MKRKKSWSRDVLEIVVAFAAAWLFYQLLAFAFGTNTPIVSVASQSMYHEKSFDGWWQEQKDYYESIGITKEKFLRFPNRHGLDMGDILFVVRDENLRAGDIIVYQPQAGCFRIQHTVVHRIVKVENGFITKGDNNAAQDSCAVEARQIEGKAILAIPLLGYPRLAIEPFVQVLQRR